MKLVTPNSTQQSEWTKFYGTIQKDAAGLGMISKELLSKLLSYR